MSTDPPRLPRSPKLRSSCDACGAAKLKCDRGQPDCGRCVSYGITCVYSLSRKMGKIPRAKQRQNQTQSSYDQSRTDDTNGFTNNSNDSGIGLDHGPFSHAGDLVDDNTNCLMISLDTFDQHDMSLMAFTPLNFGDWPLTDSSNDMDFEPMPLPTPETPSLPSCSSSGSPMAQSTTRQSQVDHLSHHENTSMPLAFQKDHDCVREAYKILGSLSFLNLTKGFSSASASSTGGISNEVPLDHVLRLSRNASKQLERLLACSCATSPSLALLFASSISRVLIWYQQAAVSTRTPSWSPGDMSLDTKSRQPSPPLSLANSSAPVSRNGSMIWSSSASSTLCGSGEKSTPASTYSCGPAVAPATMAFGTFNVDDLRVQTALKIQLLLGEMRRAGNLIDQFIASHNSDGQGFGDQANPGGGDDNLHQSLDSWLRSEHSRITNTMRLRLRELNT